MDFGEGESRRSRRRVSAASSIEDEDADLLSHARQPSALPPPLSPLESSSPVLEIETPSAVAAPEEPGSPTSSSSDTSSSDGNDGDVEEDSRLRAGSHERNMSMAEWHNMIRDRGSESRHLSLSGLGPAQARIHRAAHTASISEMPNLPPELGHQENFLGDMAQLQDDAAQRERTIAEAVKVTRDSQSASERALKLEPVAPESDSVRGDRGSLKEGRSSAAADRDSVVTSVPAPPGARGRDSTRRIKMNRAVARDENHSRTDSLRALFVVQQAATVSATDAQSDDELEIDEDNDHFSQSYKGKGAESQLASAFQRHAEDADRALPRATSAQSRDTGVSTGGYSSDEYGDVDTVRSQYTIGSTTTLDQTTAAHMARAIRQAKERMDTTSLATDGMPSPPMVRRTRIRSSFSNLEELSGMRTLTSRRAESALFVILLGCVAAICDYAIDECIRQLTDLQDVIVSSTTSTAGELLTSCFFTSILSSAAAALVFYVSPLAAGSGIGEAKYLLGGDIHTEPKRLLPPRMLFAKIVGLALAAGSGMVVGREGPFVHTSVALCEWLLNKIEYFSHIAKNGTLKRQVFAAAAAVGVSSTFSSPIGGLLFSIEVTSTYYLVANYWKGFLCAFCGAVVVRVIILLRIGENDAEEPFFATEIDGSDFSYLELWIFAILGVVMGVAGSLYVRLDTVVYEVLQCITKAPPPPPTPAKTAATLTPAPLPPPPAEDKAMSPDTDTASSSSSALGFGSRRGKRERRLPRFKLPFRIRYPKFHPIAIAAFVGMATSVIFFCTGDFISLGLFGIMRALLSTEPLDEKWTLYGENTNDDPVYVLLTFLVCYSVLTVVTTNLKLPSGNFIPCFTMGAAFGRLFANALNVGLPQFSFSPGGYALICGAAFTASVTHTISTAVIALEFTGAFDWQVPIFVCVMASFGTSLYMGQSIYDVKMKRKGFKHLPALKGDKTFQLNARDIMIKDLQVLSRKTTLMNVIERLKKARFAAVPVVDQCENMVFLGCVSRRALVRFLYHHAVKNGLEEPLKKDLVRDLTPAVVEELELSFGRSRPRAHRSRNLFGMFTVGKHSVRVPKSPKKDKTTRRNSLAFGELSPTSRTLNPSHLDENQRSFGRGLQQLKNTLSLTRVEGRTPAYPSLGAAFFSPPTPSEGKEGGEATGFVSRMSSPLTRSRRSEAPRRQEKRGSLFTRGWNRFAGPVDKDEAQVTPPDPPETVEERLTGGSSSSDEGRRRRSLAKQLPVPPPPGTWADSPDIKDVPPPPESSSAPPAAESKAGSVGPQGAEETKAGAEAPADAGSDAKVEAADEVGEGRRSSVDENGLPKRRHSVPSGTLLAPVRPVIKVVPEERPVDMNRDSVSPEEQLREKYLKHMRSVKVNLKKHREILIDPSPFRISEYMPVEQIHILFEMLRCSRVFVTSYGILVGCISRDRLIEFLIELNENMTRLLPSMEDLRQRFPGFREHHDDDDDDDDHEDEEHDHFDKK